jgi:glycosyltransferase involved in cell wall biosynthesis
MSLTISVIIPAYNSKRTIERAINSVLQQTIAPAEILIIDDKSSDETIEIIERIKSTSLIQIRLFKNETNHGVSYTRNFGIKESKCDWIAFLDADDYWHPRKLEIQSKIIKQHSANFVGTVSSLSILTINETPEVLKLTPSQMRWKNYFQTPTVLIKKNQTLLFDTSFTHAEDYDLWLRMIEVYGVAYLINEPLTILGKEPFKKSGLSSNLLKMEFGEIKALYRNGGVKKSVLPIVFSVLKYFRRILISL